MLNFEYNNPTKIVFGKNQLEKLPAYIKSATDSKKVLIAFGGGSAEKIGLLDQIRAVLSDFDLIEFGGIEANPEYETLMQAVEVCKREKIEFILAVGGGSVIDGVKFISGAAKYEGNPWHVLTRETDDIFTEAIPFGTILTIPATGSEANSGAVISRQELKEKRSMGGPLFFPQFSFIDPSLLASLPERQIANGIVDAFMHTLEQYLTHPTDNLLQEREAEAILMTLIEIAPKVIKDPSNYVLASNLFRCATHALNGNLRCGVPTDWATHAIGHELTALHGIDHARTLSIIMPRLWEEMFEQKKEKLAQYGQRVWNLSGDDVAKQAIAQTEEFLRSLGIKTKLSEYPVDSSETAAIVRKRFEERNWIELGENKSIRPENVERIVNNSI
ncbi:MAG: iron-containing alcohol dehydrogenase [Crocinitomicaceae bacterium]|nr:iron-containing alcohol dehydrogenase [Crocinitomicaceae bacterium]